jgi:hypothetical protein
MSQRRYLAKTILNVPPKFIRPCIPTTAKAIAASKSPWAQ